VCCAPGASPTFAHSTHHIPHLTCAPHLSIKLGAGVVIGKGVATTLAVPYVSPFHIRTHSPPVRLALETHHEQPWLPPLLKKKSLSPLHHWHSRCVHSINYPSPLTFFASTNTCVLDYCVIVGLDALSHYLRTTPRRGRPISSRPQHCLVACYPVNTIQNV
jgi:hypothetical protein